MTTSDSSIQNINFLSNNLSSIVNQTINTPIANANTIMNKM